MSIDVGDIVAVLKADSSQFSKGIDDANKKLESLGEGVKGGGGFDSMGAGVTSLGLKLSGVTAAMVGIGVASAKEFGKFAENIGMVSDKTGLSQKKLQELEFALHTVGMGVNDLEPAMKKFSKTFEQAIGGNDKAIEKFEKLGIDFETLKGASPDKMFDTLADAIGRIEDPLARSAALQEVFGRGGTKLVPLLKDGSEGFNKLAKEAQGLGLVFSDETLSKMAEMDDSFDKLESTMSGLARTFGATLAGPIGDFVSVLTQSLGAVNNWWQGLDEATKKVILIFTAAFAVTGPILVVVGGFMTAIAAGFGPLMIGGAVVASLLAGVGAIVANWEVLKGKTIVAWSQLKTGTVQLVMDMINGIKQWMVDKLNAIIAPVQGFADKIVGIFAGLKDILVTHSIVPDMVEEIGDHMRLLDKNMVAPSRNAARGTFQVFRQLAGEVSDTMAEISNTAISTWSSVTSTMSNALATQIVKGNDWKSTMESISISVLSAFINLGVQMIAQRVIQEVAYGSILASHQAVTLASATTEVGIMQAKNASIIAGETATATGVVGIWSATSGAVIGAFGAMTGAIQGFFMETIIPMFIQIGSAVIEFLTSIAAAEAFSIFGIPFSVGTLAGVALVAAAIASIAAFSFGAFAEGGVVTKPMMGLVGEAGPEAIIPLSEFSKVLGGKKNVTVNVELDGRTIAKSVFDNMPSVMRVRGIQA